MLEQPAAVDDFFDEIDWQVEVLAGGFEANAGVFPRKGEELTGKADLGFKALFDPGFQSLVFFR